MFTSNDCCFGQMLNQLSLADLMQEHEHGIAVFSFFYRPVLWQLYLVFHVFPPLIGP